MILSFFQVSEELNIFVSLDKEATLTLLVVENIFYYSINEIIFLKVWMESRNIMFLCRQTLFYLHSIRT